MHHAAEQHARDDREQQADHGQPTVADRGHRRVALGARRDADRRIVQPQHQRIAFDAAGGQPVAGARARRHPDLERAVGAADDFLAGEAVTLHRVGDQLSLGVVQRQRPEPRRGRHAADHHVAAPVERLLPVVGGRREGDAVAGADRQFAAAGDRGARIGIDVGGAGLRPRGPGADLERAEIGAAGRRHLGRAEADDGGDDQRQQGDEDQPHGQFLRAARRGCGGAGGAGRREAVRECDGAGRHRLVRLRRLARRGLAPRSCRPRRAAFRRAPEYPRRAWSAPAAVRLGFEDFRRAVAAIVGGGRRSAAASCPCRCPELP